MEYKLNLNLQQIAALKAATSFWEEKKVQRKVTEFLFLSEKMYITESYISKSRREWCKLTKEILDEWKKDLLPQDSEVELIHIVRMIGETIFIWFQYIIFEYGTKKKPINCITKIYWTPYGTVDAIKTFKSFCVKNSNLDIIKMYNFACHYALEDEMNDLWYKIPEITQYSCLINGMLRFDQQIQLYWRFSKKKDNIPELLFSLQDIASMLHEQDIREFNLIYDLSASTEENMLRLSVHQGYFVVMKYFWEKLIEEEKNECVLEFARIAIMRYHYYKSLYEEPVVGLMARDYHLRQYTEICIFLINQMTREDIEAFFNEEITLNGGYYYKLHRVDVKDEILNMLLDTWPWQELFIPVLKDMLTYQNDDSKMPCMFLDAITNKMVEDHELGYSIETSKYRSLLHESWLIIPKSIKQTIVRNRLETNFISHLVSIGDIDSIKLIFNHPEIEAVRDEFIDYGLKAYAELVANNQLEKLDQLMNEIFKSESEKQIFKLKINPWFGILAKHNFELADKFLDWQSSTPEERQFLKNKINHDQLCNKFLEKHDYMLVNKFLDWKFGTAMEERKKYEKNLKTVEFIIRRIRSIWLHGKHDSNRAKKQCTEFLKWVLETDDKSIIARYKKEKLGNSEMIHEHVFLAVNPEDFRSWCLLDNDETLITVLKQFLDDACMIFKRFQNGCFRALINSFKNIQKPLMDNEKNNHF